MAALDRVDGMRSVLCLFEGVVSGAADGYWRMARRPAATLLHLGPGLGNAVANLHNAKKANSGIVNIVGEHATFHIEHDAPLTADIEGIARPVSHWVRTSRDSTAVAEDGARAIAEAKAAPGRIATLILPGDTAWNAANGVAAVPEVAPPATVDDDAVEQAAKATGEGCMLLLSGDALTERGLALAGAIAAKTGSSLLAQTSNAVLQRGAGRVPVGRVPFPVLQAVEQLKDVHTVVLVGAKAPVAFFRLPRPPERRDLRGLRDPQPRGKSRRTSWTPWSDSPTASARASRTCRCSSPSGRTCRRARSTSTSSPPFSATRSRRMRSASTSP